MTIIDNDAVPGVIQFSNGTYSINENGTPVTAVTLMRTNGSDGAVSVTINLTNGTATAPSDYNNTAITVNFANGETSKTVTIPIVNDSQFETDETINLSLSNPKGGATLGTQTTAVLTILESITPTVEIANSQTEFSGTQGQNNWYYGYYDGPFNSSDFQQMNQFSSSTWYLQNGTYWTQLWATGGHPNGQITSGGRLPVQQWAVRRWVSEIDGVVDISGSVLGGSTIGRIFVNGVELLSQNISGQTANYNLRVAVQKGTFVDFAIDPKDNNDLSDSTLFTAKIIGNVVPQHGVLNLSNAQFIVNEYGTASITLTRTNGSDGEVSVILTPSNG
ncbi:MAG: Calx-beta domain-containing protein, partial [Dolichospermum sp.]